MAAVNPTAGGHSERRIGRVARRIGRNAPSACGRIIDAGGFGLASVAVGVTDRWVFSSSPDEGDEAARPALDAACGRLGYARFDGVPQRGLRAVTLPYVASRGRLAVRDVLGAGRFALACELSTGGRALLIEVFDSDVLCLHEFVDGTVERSIDYQGHPSDEGELAEARNVLVEAAGNMVEHVAELMQRGADVDEVFWAVLSAFGVPLDDSRLDGITVVGGRQSMSLDPDEPPHLEWLSNSIGAFTGVAGDEFVTGSRCITLRNTGGRVRQLVVELVPASGLPLQSYEWATLALGGVEGFVAVPMRDGAAMIDVDWALHELGLERTDFESAPSQVFELGFAGHHLRGGADTIDVRVLDDTWHRAIEFTVLPAESAPARRVRRRAPTSRHEIESLAGDTSTMVALYGSAISPALLAPVLREWALVVSADPDADKLRVMGVPAFAGVASFRRSDVGTTRRWVKLIEQLDDKTEIFVSPAPGPLHRIDHETTSDPVFALRSTRHGTNSWSSLLLTTPGHPVHDPALGSLMAALDTAADQGAFEQGAVMPAGPHVPIDQGSRYEAALGNDTTVGLAEALSSSWLHELGSTMYLPHALLVRVDRPTLDEVCGVTVLGQAARIDLTPGFRLADLERALEPVLLPVPDPPDARLGGFHADIVNMYALLDRTPDDDTT